MRKLLVSVMVAALLFAGCSRNTKQQAAASGGMALDQAIAEAAESIDSRIDAGTKIALINVESPSNRLTSYVLDELQAHLVDSGKLSVVDYRQIDTIRAEFNFHASGELSDDSLMELGRFFGVQSIVTGSLTELGGSYRMVIRVLNAQNAAVVAQYRTNVAADNQIRALIGE